MKNWLTLEQSKMDSSHRQSSFLFFLFFLFLFVELRLLNQGRTALHLAFADAFYFIVAIFHFYSYLSPISYVAKLVGAPTISYFSEISFLDSPRQIRVGAGVVDFKIFFFVEVMITPKSQKIGKVVNGRNLYRIWPLARM